MDFLKDKTLLFLSLCTLIALGWWGACYAFLWAPPDINLGNGQRIFYLHLPSAIFTFLLYTLLFLISLTYLIKPKKSLDAAAATCGILGLIFCSLTLWTGMVWGRNAWNTWWQWEPRLTTTLILWIFGVGYLMLRNGGSDQSRFHKFAAGFAVLLFLNLPITYFSVRWWSSPLNLHPVRIPQSHMDPAMRMALRSNFAAISFLVAMLFSLIYRMERLNQKLENKL